MSKKLFKVYVQSINYFFKIIYDKFYTTNHKEKITTKKKEMKKKNIKQKKQKNKESRKKKKSNERNVYWRKLHFNPNCQLLIPNLQEEGWGFL
jgi:hypothetical protein